MQNIIIMDKGTIPNDPNFGVGIRNWLFEFMDSQSLNEIREEIDRQFRKYIFHKNADIDIELSKAELPINNTNTLIIKITIHNYTRAEFKNLEIFEDISQPELIVFKFGVIGSINSNKIVSKLIV